MEQVTKKVKVLVGAGVSLGVLASTFAFSPTSVSANAYITGGTKSLEMNTYGTEATINSKKDANRAKFYKKTVKDIVGDNKASNKLFKMSSQGIEYWTPVRPKNEQGGVVSGEYIYENLYTALMYGKGGDLRNYYVPAPNISRNFKNKIIKPNTDTKAINARNYASYVQESPYMNHGGSSIFRHKTGTWRFAGYSSDGASAMFNKFPIDYSATAINATTVKKNTNGFVSYEGRDGFLFTTSIYDRDQTYQAAKRELIQRYLKQYPELKVKNVSQWMKIFSVQTDILENPETKKRDGKYGGAIFVAYTRNGTRYRSFSLTSEDDYANLNLKELTVKDANGKVLKRITRDKVGQRATTVKTNSSQLATDTKYTVEMKVQNVNKKRNTKHTPTTVDLGASLYSNSEEPNDWYNKLYDEQSWSATKDGNIEKGKTVTVTKEIKLDSSKFPAGSTVRIGALINASHRIKGDNLDFNDDDLKLNFDVVSGNMKATEVVLVDSSGKEVNNPIPGNAYKIRYKFKYDGPNMNSKTKVTVNYTITRKLPNSNTDNSGVRSGSKNIKLEKGKTYYVDSPSFVYEIPWIETEAVLSSSNPGLNTNTSDDKWSKTWSPKYDYSIKNVQVVPRTEKSDAVSHDGKQHYGVSFTAVNTMPKEAKDDYYAKNVNIRVKLGNQVKVIREHLVAGENKDIVVDFPMDKALGNGSTLNATVEVNYDHNAYENGDNPFNNNTATTKVTSKNFTTDKFGLKVNPHNNKNNTGAYATNPVNPDNMKNMTEDNNKNTWTQSYLVEKWDGTEITYKNFSGNKSYSFYKYKKPSSSQTQKKSQNETYQIKNVWMKSKITTDNNWGTNGWVSMIDAKDKGKAQVKAGYGYQLKLQVEYNTNAFTTQPTATFTEKSGQFVRPQNILPNISKDIFFQTSDGKILSVSGINGTNQKFNVKVVSATRDKVVLEFTLKDMVTMGVKTPGRIYVSENTPNGMYQVKAWTPVINGVPTKNKGTDANGLTIYKPSPLWDIVGKNVSKIGQPIPTKPGKSDEIDTTKVEEMTILVVGSDKDDLVDTIIQ